MSKEPQRGTTFVTSAPFFEMVAVPYEFHSDPRTLPQAVLSASVIDEWVTWWHWHINQLAARAKEELRRESPNHHNGLQPRAEHAAYAGGVGGDDGPLVR